MKNPFEIVEDFECAVAEYAGSKYGVAVDSCTNAIFLCCKHLVVNEVIVPARTYPSIPMSVIHAGGRVCFQNIDWVGEYLLGPYPIIDSAKRFRRGMHIVGTYRCVSFHYKKHIPIGKGGMILHDDAEADKWFRVARYEGRQGRPVNDEYIEILGWNMYMTPEQAARGLLFLGSLSDRPPDLLENYADLRKHPAFEDL